jgi:hypothetical protein
MAHQPGWPLRFTIRGVYDAADDEQPCGEHDTIDCADCGPGEPDLNVYIVEGDHPNDSPYGPRQAWDQERTS